MLSGISHDLRTPLTRLKLQLAMVKDENLSKKMSEDIDEMEKMLNDYLQFAKTQSKEDFAKVNLIDLIKGIVKISNSSQIQFEYKDSIFINGRENALKRCFQNILENALTYGEKVKISLKETSNRVVITIEDDGPGIPSEQFKNVFKPFHRLDKSRSMNKKGVGLGLAIVEDIVNSHGGNIQLSKSQLGGLLFKVSLPS